MSEDNDENENEETTTEQTAESTENTSDSNETHSVEDDFDFSEFGDTQAGYYDAEGNYLGEDDAAAQEAAKSHGDDSFLTENWSESQDDFGYEVNDDGSTKINLHNAGKAIDDAKHAVKGWAETKADQINQFFGGARGGYTNADRERAEEASKAWNTYDEKAKTAEKALNDFANKYDKNNKEDVDKYNQLKSEYEDLTARRDSINRDIKSTDTGSRLGNIGGNIKEDLGDVGTAINQFFGGADQYGLDSRGRINDRDGDGKVSIGERALNIGRNVATWAGNQLKNYGTAALGGALSLGNPLLGYGITKATQKGIDALVDYARSHPNNLTSQEKAELAQAEKEANSTNDSSSYEDEPNEPVQNASISADNTPQVARNNWTDMKLNALGNNQQSFGGWNKVNDTMGQKTLALSDAHFKDFVLAMMTDEPGIHEIIKTRLMLDYFK